MEWLLTLTLAQQIDLTQIIRGSESAVLAGIVIFITIWIVPKIIDGHRKDVDSIRERLDETNKAMGHLNEKMAVLLVLVDPDRPEDSLDKARRDRVLRELESEKED